MLRSTLGKSFRIAFGSFWALFGILFSASAAFNFISQAVGLSLAGVFQKLFSGFRFFFHPIVDALLFWVPFELPDLWKDGLVIWFTIGAATVRAFLSYRRAIIKETRNLAHNSSFNIFVRSAFLWPAGVLFSLILWPIMWPVFLVNPIVIEDPGSDGAMCLPMDGWKKANETWPEAPTLVCDLRIVLLLQLTTIVAVIVTLMVVNAVNAGW